MGQALPEDFSTLTVAELKEFCKENGLSMSGKKADLVDRLDSHFNEESISLEEVISVPLPKVDEEDVLDEEEVLDAEVLDAEVIDEEEAVEEITPLAQKEVTLPTLKDQLQNPKVIAVLLTILVASGGWYWYTTSQLQPFVADDLRYGDSMDYSVIGGNMEATGGYIDLVLDNIELEDEDICRLQVEFAGDGTTSVTKGTSEDILFESDNSLLGNVQAKGAYGANWLAVEKKQTKDFDSFSVTRYKYNPLSPSNCISQGAGVGGSMQFNTTSWTEIAERDVISTQADWNLNLDGDYWKGTTFSFGVGGILGVLDDLAPGVAMVISPVELREMMGGKLIDTDANGTHLGWEWRVVGTDEIGDEELWKVTMEHREIRDNCLGFARIVMWVNEDSPWAVKQNVDIEISDSGSSQSSCSTLTEQLADLVLPEGELKFSVEMSEKSIKRGSKLLTLGRNYDSMPNPGAYVPKSDELSDWGANGLHLPDNSVLRDNTLEHAVQCLTGGFVSEAVAANAALNDDGYIWRAVDDNGNQTDSTLWNLSWVSGDPNSGWVVIDVSGEPSNSNCTYVGHGSNDETVQHSRNDIPAALNLTMIEEDLTDQYRYPVFSGPDGFFTSAGEYHPETRIGYLVVTPDGDLTDWINRLNSGDTGTTTIDMSRSWETTIFDPKTQTSTDWDNSLNMIMDATNGQVVGWNYLTTPIIGE